MAKGTSPKDSGIRAFVNKMTKPEEEGGHGSASVLSQVWAWIVVHYIAFKFNAIELLTRHRKLNLESIGQRKGDVAVVTGGTRGIGVEVVKKLLKCDMHVIMGCRNVTVGNELINRFRAEGVTTGSAECLPLDLMSLDSVQEFAKQVNAKHGSINILVNNAGIMFVPYQETVDGFESHFQVNYLSHFFLTRLLHQALMKGGKKGNRNSRVVNVSSCASFGGKVNFSDLQLKRNYCKFNAYMYTKFLQVISSNTLNRKYMEEGAHINSYSLHPGIIFTDLYDSIPWLQLFRFLLPLMFKNPDQGSDTVAYAALSPDIEKEGGIFLANSQKIAPNPKSNDIQAQDNLYSITCDLLDNKLNK